MGTERIVHPQPKEAPGSSDPEQWVELHGEILYRFALLRLRHPKSAEEIVQETFLAALESHRRFQGRSSERSWLIGILKHKVIDHFRKRRREEPSQQIETFVGDMDGRFDENGHWRRDETGPAEWAADPEVLLERKEFWTVMERCLSKLPVRMARAFFLREIDDIDSREVCDILEISSSNLWVLLHRARMQLRQCLEIHFFGIKRGQPIR